MIISDYLHVYESTGPLGLCILARACWECQVCCKYVSYSDQPCKQSPSEGWKLLLSALPLAKHHRIETARASYTMWITGDVNVHWRKVQYVNILSSTRPLLIGTRTLNRTVPLPAQCGAVSHPVGCLRCLKSINSRASPRGPARRWSLLRHWTAACTSQTLQDGHVFVMIDHRELGSKSLISA
jgi:hypothetical protein